MRKENVMMEQSKSEFREGAGLGPIKGTPLHIIWICDVSDSMRHGNRIVELNLAMENAINELKEFNKCIPHVQIFMRTIKFSTSAEWIDRENIPVQSYHFTPLESDGGATDLGEALSKVADLLRYEKDGGIMPEKRSKAPCLVLITDGYPTDDWESGLNKLMSTFWGENAVRMAVALGDAAHDEFILGILKQFIGNVWQGEEKLLRADNLQLSDILYGTYTIDDGLPKIPE